MDFSWFLTIPGMLITGGVLLLIIALIITYVINPPVATFNTWLSEVLKSMGGTSKILLGMILLC